MSENSAYSETIRTLSQHIVEAQTPIRILDAIKWDAEVKHAFFKSKFKTLPPVDLAYYQARPLGYDPIEKRKEFHLIEREIIRKLGSFSPVGQILRRMCREYGLVVRMLEARGKPEFCMLSEELYGSATDVFHEGDPTLASLGASISDALQHIDKSMWLTNEEKTIPAEEAVEILKARLSTFFQKEDQIRIIISDGIIADAAAGADYIKIRKDAKFTERELRILEVHEGWVHVGTTLNGLHQPVCTFLSKGPPSSTVTQEGLAILVEIISFASFPERLSKLANRIRAIDMAERGAHFIEVFRFFMEEGYSEEASYSQTSRVFRGSLPNQGPFTKDLSYCRGFVLVYNFIQLAVRRGKLSLIPLLFCGKTTLEDIQALHALQEEGILKAPRYLPPQFADLNALTAWMCYSNFLNQLSLSRIESDYASILGE